MPRNNEAQFLHEVLLGRKDAVEFCQLIFRISQTWDDLIDGDRRVAPEDINRAFWMAIVEVPANPFYRRHFAYLHPLLAGYITDWLDANELQLTDGDHGRNIAFVLRDSVGALVSQAAYLIGGYEYLRKVSPDIRRHIFEDSLGEYKKRLAENEPAEERGACT